MSLKSNIAIFSPQLTGPQALLYINYNSIRFVHTQLNDKTVLFLTILFNTIHLFLHSLNVKQFYSTLSGITTPGQSGHESIGNKGVLHISIKL